MHLVVEVTYKCPAKCPHCPLKNERKNINTISLSNFRDVLKLFSEYFYNKRKLLTISGGEPTTLKGLRYYVDVAQQLGYKVTVITNGYNPKRILEAKPDYIQISLDYFGSKHDSMRGLAVWSNILKLLDYIKKGELNGFVRFTLTNDNLNDLITIRTKLDELGLKKVKIYAMPIRGCPEKSPSREDIFIAMDYAILPSRCPAGKGMFVITPDLRVLDCIFHRKELGCLEKFTLAELEAIIEAGKHIPEYPCGDPYWWAQEVNRENEVS